MSSGVEINKVAGPHIDRARTEARHPGVEAIKINQALQRALELLCIVEAGRPERAARLEPWHQGPPREKTAGAGGGREVGAHLVEEIARIVASGQINEWIG